MASIVDHNFLQARITQNQKLKALNACENLFNFIKILFLLLKEQL